MNRRTFDKLCSSENNCKTPSAKNSTPIEIRKPSLQCLMNHKLDVQDHDRIQKIETFPLGNRPSNDVLRIKQPIKLKVRTEKSAIVFALIVTLFLLTHSYRMALKVYEVAMPNAFSVQTFELCFSLKRLDHLYKTSKLFERINKCNYTLHCD